MKFNVYYFGAFSSFLFAIISFFTNLTRYNFNLLGMQLLNLLFIALFITVTYMTRMLFVYEYKLNKVALLFDIYIVLFLLERTLALIAFNLAFLAPYAAVISYAYLFVVAIMMTVNILIYYFVFSINDRVVKLIAFLNIFTSAIFLLERVIVMSLYFMGSELLKSDILRDSMYWAMIIFQYLYTFIFILLGYLFLGHANKNRSKLYSLLKKLFPKKFP